MVTRIAPPELRFNSPRSPRTACASDAALRVGDRLHVSWDLCGRPIVDISEASRADLRRGSAVGSFSDLAPNETKLGPPRPGEVTDLDDRVGWFRTIEAARLADDSSLLASSSGGLTSWLAQRLLDGGHADAVLHVTSTPEDGELLGYVVSDRLEFRRRRRKSNYYATSMQDVLMSIRGDGRLASREVVEVVELVHR